MGKTYKKVVRNKFEKKKFNNLKRKQFEGDEEDEFFDEEEELRKVREENRTHEPV